jgi:L-amino acid N-acyltransferase YncA
MPYLIRLATPADGPAMAAIYAPHVQQRATSFELVAPDGAQMAQRAAAVLARWPWLVREEDGELLGYCYASAFAERAAYQWSVTVSAYVRESHLRRGVGRSLYATLFELLRRQGVFNAFAGITLPNEASVGMHAALGFERVGLYPRVGFKLGRWHDVAWLGLHLQPQPDDQEPAAPISLPALLAGGGLADLLPHAGTA